MNNNFHVYAKVKGDRMSGPDYDFIKSFSSKEDAHKHISTLPKPKNTMHSYVIRTKKVNEDTQTELDERSLSSSEMGQRENIVKSMKKNYSDFRKRYGEKAKSVMYATATKMAKEDVDCEEEIDLEEMHYCAKHVYSEVFGEGIVLEGAHADPDEDGEISWYMVEFADGIRKISTEKLEVMMAEYHMNHKKKKKMMEEDDLEESEGGIPKTAAHKKLAAHYGDPNKITRGDIITAAKKNAKAKGM